MRHITILAMVLMMASLGRSAKASNSLPPNQFATDLFRQLPADSNLVCSPLSVFAAMSMTSTGAAGKTAQELAIFDASHSGVGDLLAGLQTPDPDFQLHIANAVWIKTGFKVRPEFQNDLSQKFHAQCASVDFTNPSASQTINAWVSSQTAGKIPDLFSSGSLPPDAALVLTNAIYFHADWLHPFLSNHTSPSDFYVPNQTEPVHRRMMHERGSFPITHADQFDAIELPYKGDKVSMLIVLPKTHDGLKTIESQLSEDFLNHTVAGLQSRFVELSIPKFSFPWQISLRDSLINLGITRAFNPAEADFSGISDSSSRLFISDVVQKAYISVDEAGTEAAAATGVVVMPTAIPARGEVFNADHPFLFVIRDDSSGAILFTGRVLDPGQ